MRTLVVLTAALPSNPYSTKSMAHTPTSSSSSCLLPCLALDQPCSDGRPAVIVRPKVDPKEYALAPPRAELVHRGVLRHGLE